MVSQLLREPKGCCKRGQDSTGIGRVHEKGNQDTCPCLLGHLRVHKCLVPENQRVVTRKPRQSSSEPASSMRAHITI